MDFLPLLLAACALLPGEGPDRVELVKGKKVLEGRVLLEGKDEVVLRVAGREQRIPRGEIESITSLERSVAELLEPDLRTADVATLAGLAERCRAVGLEHEARNLWLRILLADPGNEAAVKGLDGQRVQEDVRVMFGKDRRRIADLTKRQESWKDAFEIATTHFVVRTDLDLAFALDLGLALERFHRRFYDTLGSPLELYVFDESPEVEVYASSKDFPMGPVRSATIWFAPGENKLHVLAATDPRIGAVVHELSKQMLFNALRRGAGTTAQVPAWTSAGIAETFADAAPEERFGPWSDLAEPDEAAFELAQRAKVDLERLFNSTRNDFVADARRDEMTASAYTLVHFLVFGQAGELRAKYGEFLREGAKGKISLQAFEDALGMKRQDIERVWRAHVDAKGR